MNVLNTCLARRGHGVIHASIGGLNFTSKAKFSGGVGGGSLYCGLAICAAAASKS